MKQDRFLTSILIGIGALAIAAVGVFSLRQGAQDYIADDTPDGVVHNYVFALHQGDLQRAYGYLADKEGKPEWKDFQAKFKDFSGASSGMQIVGFKLTEDDDGNPTARVELNEVSPYGGGPFGGYHSSSRYATLVSQEGEWKLIEMSYYYWDWDWYKEPPEDPYCD